MTCRCHVRYQVSLTDRTITDRAALEREAAAVRERDYASGALARRTAARGGDGDAGTWRPVLTVVDDVDAAGMDHAQERDRSSIFAEEDLRDRRKRIP